jgi:hypothetical protein
MQPASEIAFDIPRFLIFVTLFHSGSPSQVEAKSQPVVKGSRVGISIYVIDDVVDHPGDIVVVEFSGKGLPRERRAMIVVA